jgi:hypothetical protein
VPISIAQLWPRIVSRLPQKLLFLLSSFIAWERGVYLFRRTRLLTNAEERELGGAYSDSLVIELASSEVPAALSSLYCQEATLEGYDLKHESPPVIDGRFLFLWWD